MKNFDEILAEIATKGNTRHIPDDTTGNDYGYLDFSTNDYLGLADDKDLRFQFLKEAADDHSMLMSSSASRLLAATQRHHLELENALKQAYGGIGEVLLFNSGYHANTGILPAIADRSTLIIADKLIHASLIDGIVLARCDFQRFPHNDIDALERIVKNHHDKYQTLIIVAESVYSMDGDRAPLNAIAGLKQKYDNLVLYLDEAHAFGVVGPNGLGLAQGSKSKADWDIVIGTFGKAAASMGAFAVVHTKLKEVLVNKSRSLIFSTALPPLQAAWTKKIIEMLPDLEYKRKHLRQLSHKLSETLSPFCSTSIEVSHIQPLIVGDAKRSVELSKALLDNDIKVLAIRTPTVPAGTERLRFSLSATMTYNDIDKLRDALEDVFKDRF